MYAAVGVIVCVWRNENDVEWKCQKKALLFGTIEIEALTTVVGGTVVWVAVALAVPLSSATTINIRIGECVEGLLASVRVSRGSRSLLLAQVIYSLKYTK